MNYTLFISDLHLQESQSKKTDLFLQLLTSKALKADALYILGDFFEIWIGDDDNSLFNEKIKGALKKFSATGIPIYFMHGNRDFLIGKKFIQDTGCRLIKDPTKINLYGIPTLLTHGDILTKGTSYLRYRKLAHNAKCQKLFLLLPITFRKAIANYLRAKSKKIHNLTTNIEPEITIQLMKQHDVTQLIHGHIHNPAIHDIKINGKHGKYITLGAWEDNSSILVYRQNSCFWS